MAPELPGDLAERGTLPQARPATLPVPAAEWTVPPSDQRSPYQLPWDWWDFLAISLLWLAFVVLSGPIVFAVLGEPDTAADPRYIIASNLQITIVLLGWVMARSRPIGVLRGWRLLLGPKQLTWNDVGWGVIHGVIGWVMVTFALGSLLELLAGALGRELPAVQEQLQDVVRADRTALLTGIATILVAPLVEELMFRGVLLHGLYRRLPAVAGGGADRAGVRPLPRRGRRGDPAAPVRRLPRPDRAAPGLGRDRDRGPHDVQRRRRRAAADRGGSRVAGDH